MIELLLESSIVGLITCVIGIIVFNLSVMKENKTNEKEKDKPSGIGMAFFLTGAILNLLLEYSGFNNWYCSKKTGSKMFFLSKLSNI